MNMRSITATVALALAMFSVSAVAEDSVFSFDDPMVGTDQAVNSISGAGQFDQTTLGKSPAHPRGKNGSGMSNHEHSTWVFAGGAFDGNKLSVVETDTETGVLAYQSSGDGKPSQNLGLVRGSSEGLGLAKSRDGRYIGFDADGNPIELDGSLATGQLVGETQLDLRLRNDGRKRHLSATGTYDNNGYGLGSGSTEDSSSVKLGSYQHIGVTTNGQRHMTNVHTGHASASARSVGPGPQIATSESGLHGSSSTRHNWGKNRHRPGGGGD